MPAYVSFRILISHNYLCCLSTSMSHVTIRPRPRLIFGALSFSSCKMFRFNMGYFTDPLWLGLYELYMHLNDTFIVYLSHFFLFGGTSKFHKLKKETVCAHANVQRFSTWNIFRHPPPLLPHTHLSQILDPPLLFYQAR